ncbi:MAG: UDP-N-acetylmuramoyl-L-alanine--D-glutamate ligase [Alphaproteobacteria bacterium]|nr:UDP-N-acetylmuramoyl-L-alanine--D-glutamate ligase [Alphaproteobacteria bacterium]
MKAVVLGLGASGVAAARLLVQQGWDVTGVDLREHLPPIAGVTMELGPHRRETFLAADRIVVSPGVPSTQPDIVAAEAAGIPVWSEVALAVDHLGDVPIVGITGTNGKSTVTHFTGQLLGREHATFVGGNLGTPLSAAVDTPYAIYVLELSSYQLERPGSLRPRAGVILNLTPDHLARHGDMRGYAAAKARLFDNLGPGDLALVPHDDALLREAVRDKPGTHAWLGAEPGIVREGRVARIRLPDIDADIDLSGLTVPGEHNLDNAAVAAGLALAMGASVRSVQDGIRDLTALEHRMQPVPTSDGRRWIDDSKATNVASTLAALKGRTVPTVLLLGGQSKGPGFAALAGHLASVHTVICFGGDGPAIHAELAGVGVASTLVGSLGDAVELARERSAPGDDVLLSPGCASFDAFTDFAHRGREFARMATTAQET